MLAVVSPPARSNSFNLVARGDVLRPPGAPCPLRQGPARVEQGVDVLRAAYLRLRDRMRLFVTTTRDFDEAELEEVKRGQEQLYVDVSSKLMPDDFASDLRKLRLSAECRACARRTGCPGCYVAEPGNAFAEDDARLRARLRELRGAVLDVGCGEAPYAEEFEAAASAGCLSYVGVEPEASRVALLRARHAWARYVVGTLESAAESGSLGRGGYQHVLFMRSFNHLPDPAQSLALAARWLAPEGRLWLVDNVAFGLLRSREQAHRAEQGPGQLEHFRNDSAAEAAALGSSLGWRVAERWDIGPSTSNQWLLSLERP